MEVSTNTSLVLHCSCMWRKRGLRKRMLFYAFAAVTLLAILPRIMREFVIYQPSHNVNESTLQELQFFRFAPLTEEEENSPFRGFIHVPNSPQKIIVIFSGNAGQAADRIYIAREMIDQKAVIMLAEYPGYGIRHGKPSENSLYASALEDVKFLQSHFPDVPLILVGESLGSGVASWLAGKLNVDGLVLISPFTSLADVAKAQVADLPIGWLVPDRFDSEEWLKKMSKPALLVVHGKEDQLVPFKLGEKLFEDYAGPKKMIAVGHAGHNDLPWNDPNSEMWHGIKNFLKTL